MAIDTDLLRTALAGRYRIEREIGRGGMAVVYLAHDLKHDRSVAVKVLRPEFANAIGADRFHREIEVVAGLTHPHILPLHDSGEAAGLLYYVMPYVQGDSLRRRLDRKGPLPIPAATRMARQIAGALGFAHRHGVIHRDVKPGNILLSEDQSMLADFGIAHLAETETTSLTLTGLTLGTPAYFSPEQATGEHDIDGRSDIYSLGCVLYEALTGQPPFAPTSVQALITHHILDEPPQLEELRPDASEGLEAVVHTALRKEPEERFQTAEEMGASLELVSGGFEAVAAAALRKLIGPRHRWMHGWRLALAATATVVLLVAGGLGLRSVLQRPVFSGTYTTYAILPWEGEDLTEEEKRLARAGARALYYHLADWESIRVVGGPSIEGPSQSVAQAGFGIPTLSLMAGLALLERLNATHLIYVDANAEADSVELLASIFEGDARTPERLVQASGAKSDIKLISAGLALQILEVDGEAAKIADLVSRSANHGAVQQLDEGRAALWDWRLAEAEAHFRAAIEADTLFALAHYLLATTMYWRAVQNPERMLDGPAVAFHARQADRLGVDRRLRPGERDDVNAFLSFFTGDYARARARYDTILERKPTHLEALVLAGAVELEDPWLTVDGDGHLLPRRDLNRARDLFDSAVSLQSDVQLAWGSLFEIDREVARATHEGTCYGFQPPGAPLFPPYEYPEAADQLTYCPYVDDGVIQWRADSLLAEHRQTTMTGVRELQKQTIERLERWTRVERDQPRPHEELTEWMLWERSVPGCAAEPRWADSLLRNAHSRFNTALALRGDTTPEQRVRLAMLLLATDNLADAIGHTDRALSELGEWRSDSVSAPPLEAANVYMAGGRGRDAAEVLERVWSPSTFAVPDPESDGEFLPGGRVWGALWGLAAIGITTGDLRDMGHRFDLLDRTWGQPGYTDRQRAELRYRTTGLASHALIHDPARWDAWFEGWDEMGLEMPPVWKGLRLAEEDPIAARAYLKEAVEDLSSDLGRTLRAYHFNTPISLADVLGENAIKADLEARARTCPLAVNRVDLGWGMTR